MSFNENIKKVREEKGLTQAEVAEAVGVSRVLICQIENGIRKPSLVVGKLIADKLECTVEELM